MLSQPLEFALKPLRGVWLKVSGSRKEFRERSEAKSIRTPSIEYHADIDGLRAIAVLLVLFYHGGLTLFPSGFVGVDIFFVISGYLTTAIIMKSLEHGTFSFSEFYTRRIWRLQPAVLALLVATLLVATVLYLPTDYVDFLKSEKYTSLVLSNQYFSKVTTGYATPHAATLPLLHTWSLAIEWQWYLALPLGIWLLYRYVPKKFFKATAFGLTIGAVALALYLSHAYPDKNYYFFTARIFELLIGSCAFIFGADRFKLNRLGASLICVLSLAIIGYCATRENILAGFPGFHAVAVCIATAALLFRGIGDASITAKLLSLKPLVYIGTLSYSLYLWHWPILAVLSYMGVTLSPMLRIVYFIATFIIAIISFALIENKYRKARAGIVKTLVALIILPAVLFSILYSVGAKYEGWPSRFGSGSDNVLNVLKGAVPVHREDCMDASDGVDANCILGATQPAPQVFLMGDSYSNHYWGFTETLAKDANLSVLAQSHPACLALPNIYLYTRHKNKSGVYQRCHDAAQRYYDIIASNDFKYVILGENWELYLTADIVTKPDDPRSPALSQQRLGVAIRDALDLIVESGATPVFLKSLLPMPEGINECLFKQVKLRSLMGSAEQSRRCSSVPWSGVENEVWEELFNDLKAEYPSLIIVDPKRLQCTAGLCMTTVDGLPIYRDVGHMTDYASYRFGEMYLKRFGNPLKSAQ